MTNEHEPIEETRQRMLTVRLPVGMGARPIAMSLRRTLMLVDRYGFYEVVRLRPSGRWATQAGASRREAAVRLFLDYARIW